MARDLDLQRIQERLERNGATFGRTNGNSSADDPMYKPEPESRVNSGMIATLAAALIAVASGTFLYGESIMSSFSGSASVGKNEFVSLVDGDCGKGWREGLPNPDQMQCYMTQQVNRLCDPDEKASFVARVEQYDRDYAVWFRKHMAHTVGVIGKIQKNSMQIGLEGAKTTAAMSNKNLSEADRMKQMEKMGKIVGDTMGQIPDAEYLASTKVKIYQLEGIFAKLVDRGLVQKSDFGWKSPDWVKNAFRSRENKVIKSACLAR